MSITFKQISPKEAYNSYQAVLDNGRSLIKAGTLLGKKGNYGVACSLLILGGEELVKSGVLFLLGHGVELMKIKEMEKVFFNHKVKHDTAFFPELIGIFEYFLQAQEIPKNKKSSFLDNFGHFLNQALMVLSGLKQVGENLDWWENADNLKKQGFYVDYKDGLISPKEITKAQYDEANEIIKGLSIKIRVLPIIFRARSDDEKHRFVQMLNQGIDLKVEMSAERKKLVN